MIRQCAAQAIDAFHRGTHARGALDRDGLCRLQRVRATRPEPGFEPMQVV